MALLAEGCAGGSQRARDDEQLAGPRARSAGDALRAADRGDGEEDRVRPGRVAAHDGDAGLVHAGVELQQVVELGLGGRSQGHEQRFRLGARGCEVAEVDRRGLEAELAPRRPVEPEVDALDERVLGDDDSVGEARRVVLDSSREAAALELREQAGLAELREPHRSPPAAPPRLSPRG